MSFRELVNENGAESADRKDKVNATDETRIAEPRAVASGCYDQLTAGSDRSTNDASSIRSLLLAVLH